MYFVNVIYFANHKYTFFTLYATINPYDRYEFNQAGVTVQETLCFL